MKFFVVVVLIAGGVFATWRMGYLPFIYKGDTALVRLPSEIRAFVKQDENRALLGAYLRADKEVTALRRSILKAHTEAEREEQIKRLFDATFSRQKAGRDITDAYVAAHGQTFISGRSRPVPISIHSSAALVFRDASGHAQIWYALKQAGEGYDLFKGVGVGEFKTDDGRRMHLIEYSVDERKITEYVDVERRREAEELAKRKAAEEAQRKVAEEERRREAIELAKRKAAEEEQRKIVEEERRREAAELAKRKAKEEEERRGNMPRPPVCATCKGGGTIVCQKCKGVWDKVIKRVTRTCIGCRGTGQIRGIGGRWMTHLICGGTGKIITEEFVNCPHCNQGKITCPYCNDGKVRAR